MWQLIKRDLIHIKFLFVFALLFPLVLYAIQLPTPSVYVFSLIFIFLIASAFHLEKLNKANRTWVSLPIKRSHFVLGRYIFIFATCTLYLLYLWFINSLFSKDQMSVLLILLAFIVIVIAIAFSLPVYYAFQSVWKSIIVHYLLLMIGSLAFVFTFADPFNWFEPFILLVLNVIDFQPFVVVTVFLIVLTYFSYVLSCHLFKTKDIN